MNRDLLGLVDRAYRLDLDQGSWVRDIAETASRHIGEVSGTIGCIAHLDGERVRTSDQVFLGNAVDRRTFERSIGSPAVGLSRVFRDPAATGGPDPGIFEGLAELWRPLGCSAVTGLAAYDGGAAAALWIFVLGKPRLQRRDERRTWSRVATHLGTGFRLRRVLSGGPQKAPPAGDPPESPSTAAGGDGHAGGSTNVQRRLRDLALAAQAGRRRAGNAKRGEGRELWTGLCTGRWTLIDRFDAAGRRYLVACKNALEDSALSTSLTERQCQVARLAAEGQSNTEIAYATRLDESTVSTHLQNVLLKLGLRSRVQLAATFWALTHPESQVHEVMKTPIALRCASTPLSHREALNLLTSAEQEVVHLLVAGLSNREIARRRGTSARTVANQVASILAKTGAQSRAHLAALIG